MLFNSPATDADRPHNRARQALQKAEQLYPQIDHRVIGQLYLHYRYMELAAEQFELVVKAQISDPDKKPFDTQVLLLLAEVKEILGEGLLNVISINCNMIIFEGFTEEAKALYEFALRVDPNNEFANTGLALLLLGTVPK